MAQDICVLVDADDRARLAAIAGDRSGPHKHVLRARIVLFSAERLPVSEVARRAGVSRPAVWRWQRRFAEAGVDGLLREKPRIPGKPPLPRATVERVVTLTCTAPPGEATHWSGRAMARAVGIGLSSVQRIWKAHGLQTHRIRTFKRSRDPAFADKLRDIVGLYMDPPAHAIVLSIDEKSQIQALDRSQPGLPLKPGKCATMTHDYKRHGTTTLFAALNVLDGTVIGRCMQRHRHQEFIRFLNAIERQVPAGKVIHVVLDNYSPHKTPGSLRTSLVPSQLLGRLHLPHPAGARIVFEHAIVHEFRDLILRQKRFRLRAAGTTYQPTAHSEHGMRRPEPSEQHC